MGMGSVVFMVWRQGKRVNCNEALAGTWSDCLPDLYHNGNLAHTGDQSTMSLRSLSGARAKPASGGSSHCHRGGHLDDFAGDQQDKHSDSCRSSLYRDNNGAHPNNLDEHRG